VRRRLALATCAALLLQGCYLGHITVGQAKILLGREDLDDVLERDDLTPARRGKLELVRAVRRFGIEVMGLAETDGYTTVYDTGAQPVAWNVSASDKDCFAPRTWWFPITGAIPYLGFFDRGLARDEASRLRRQGLDALLLPVPAYSTLGWFDDPIFTATLKLDESSLAELVLHEMAHATAFVPGDASLNENLASFIGRKGAEAFFLARGGPADPALADMREDDRQAELFAAEVRALHDELWRLYAATGRRADVLRRRKQTVDAWRRRFGEVVLPQLNDPRWDAVVQGRIEFNNAFLLMFARYHGEAPLYEALWRAEGRDLTKLVQALIEIADADEPRKELLARAARAPKE
jgi:predicted aminopeptidase